MTDPEYHDPPETFCLYCQVEYRTERGLIDHLKLKHVGTYAYYSFVPKEERVGGLATPG